MQFRTGQCLCGAVKFRAEAGREIHACHCTQCQRWTGGGPYLSVAVEGLQIDGEESIRVFHASSWGERANCAICGSILYWRMQGKPVRSMALGLLDDQSGLSMTDEIFVDYRPDWLEPYAGASQSTEAEMNAQLEAFLNKEKTS